MDNRKEEIGRITGTLESVVSILRAGKENPATEALESAAWRLADAGLRLRNVIESDPGWHDVAGVHFPTGMGAMLPQKQK